MDNCKSNNTLSIEFNSILKWLKIKRRFCFILILFLFPYGTFVYPQTTDFSIDFLGGYFGKNLNEGITLNSHVLDFSVNFANLDIGFSIGHFFLMTGLQISDDSSGTENEYYRTRIGLFTPRVSVFPLLIHSRRLFSTFEMYIEYDLLSFGSDYHKHGSSGRYYYSEKTPEFRFGSKFELGFGGEIPWLFISPKIEVTHTRPSFRVKPSDVSESYMNAADIRNFTLSNNLHASVGIDLSIQLKHNIYIWDSIYKPPMFFTYRTPDIVLQRTIEAKNPKDKSEIKSRQKDVITALKRGANYKNPKFLKYVCNQIYEENFDYVQELLSLLFDNIGTETQNEILSSALSVMNPDSLESQTQRSFYHFLFDKIKICDQVSLVWAAKPNVPRSVFFELLKKAPALNEHEWVANEIVSTAAATDKEKLAACIEAGMKLYYKLPLPSPLICAASARNNESVDLIFEKGREFYCNPEISNEVFLSACGIGSLYLVEKMLKKCSKDLLNTKDNDGENALFYAARGLSPELIGMLLKNGLDPNEPNKELEIPLKTAVNSEFKAFFDNLLKNKVAVAKHLRSSESLESEKCIKLFAEYESYFPIPDTINDYEETFMWARSHMLFGEVKMSQGDSSVGISMLKYADTLFQHLLGKIDILYGKALNNWHSAENDYSRAQAEAANKTMESKNLSQSTAKMQAFIRNPKAPVVFSKYDYTQYYASSIGVDAALDKAVDLQTTREILQSCNAFYRSRIEDDLRSAQ